METRKEELSVEGIRLSVQEKDKEVAHAYLYVMRNDLHEEPFGLVEDIFVEEAWRGKGYGTELLKELIEEARRRRCYKIIATSRHSRENVHRWYQKLSFRDHGVEFRLDL